ncbi:MAG TPA: RNA polymerase sigma factor [Mesorhizobium sp.]|nr:RNA polymerase sigma factor [Mesorhizobium sp.]
MGDSVEAARAAAEAAARRSYGKLIAFLAARTRDVAAAEDALSEGFAAALTAWPKTGVPEHPEAWLMTAARRSAIDALRRRQTSIAAEPRLKLMSEEMEAAVASESVPDERLGLMFACAHPAIDASVRAPLMLQTILGFDAATIASAFLVPPATMGQRLVRAKNRIRQAGIPLKIPDQDALAERLSSVLEAIYAAFAEGWTDPAGTDARRRNLSDEGIWLGRLVVSLLPEEPEALGLLALMLFAEARRATRRNTAGDYVPLSEQDTAEWDTALINEAEVLLRKASGMAGIGRYQLEAAVQSAHAARRLTGSTDWPAIALLYDALSTVADSPVVTINRAVAIAEAGDPREGMAELDRLEGDKRLSDYQPYWAARAGLLAQLGDTAAAHAAYQRAIGLELDEAVRRFLQKRSAELRGKA